MRLVTVEEETRTFAGRVEDDAVIDLGLPDVGSLLVSGPPALEEAARTKGTRHDLGSVTLAPVIPRPGKIICVGLNYRSHIAEMGRDEPEYPTLFATFADALIGPTAAIVLPRSSVEVDWEAELALVIGNTVRHAARGEGAAAIVGFTVYNDISVRDWQNRTPQWLQGKTFENTSPLGPWLTTIDETGPEPALEIGCEIDGRSMQSGSTADLVFSPAAIVEYVSAMITLRPGDIIATGTPSGVGAGLDPPVYLKKGQVVRTYIEGIGELTNVCVEEPPQ